MDYDESLARLTRDIECAREHVHLLYYIFAYDETTEPIVRALELASRRGVRCRVLVDALGSRRSWRRLVRPLRRAGVEVRQTLPYGILRSGGTRFDLRNHRKIAVIDGRIGYTGSQNLVDANYSPAAVYEELVVRLEGPIVLQMQYVFAADWFLETGQVLSDPDIAGDPGEKGEHVVQALPSGPLFETDTAQRLVVSQVYSARTRVVITTPYFVPDEALLQALETAVMRGVDVVLIVPKSIDQYLVRFAQESYYADLLSIGVSIYCYSPRFLHAKHISFDDEIAIIGSVNMDIRSFQLNEEFSLIFYSEEVAYKLREEQSRYMKNADEITENAWRRRNKARRVAQNIARLLSPLL